MSESISELRSVTCHMGSRSVTCHPTEVNAPRLNPSQIGRYSIYLPRRDGRLSWPRRLVTSQDGLQAVTHRSINRALRTVTSLIRSDALPLHHAYRPKLHLPMSKAKSSLHMLRVTWPVGRRVQNDHIFRIPKFILPIHYTTSMGLRWPLRAVCRWNFYA